VKNNQKTVTVDKSKLKTELLIIFISSIFVFLLAYRYNILEEVVDYTRQHENWQLDEVLIVSVYLMLAFAVYSFRRWRDVQVSRKRLAQKNAELQTAFNEIKRLRGMIPICSSCQNIRDDSGYWHEVAAYISDHSEAEFTHSLCPYCMQKLYPDYIQDEMTQDEMTPKDQTG